MYQQNHSPQNFSGRKTSIGGNFPGELSLAEVFLWRPVISFRKENTGFVPAKTFRASICRYIYRYNITIYRYILFGHRKIDSARHGTWKIMIEREWWIQTNPPRFGQFFYSALSFSSHNGGYAYCIFPDSSPYGTPQRSVFVVHMYELLFEFSVYFEKVIR